MAYFSCKSQIANCKSPAYRPMFPSAHVSVQVDLPRVRQNVELIARRTGVPIIAVVKADAYGLGARQVAKAIGDLVDGFYVFDAAEAMRYALFDLTGRRTIVLRGDSPDAADYLARRIQPVAWTEDRARALRPMHPIVSVDTGQQRFGCDRALLRQIAAAGDIQEAMTHATTVAQASSLKRALDDAGLVPCRAHAAGSSLLDQPAAWLDTVRPGLAMYRGAVRVTTHLVEARDSTGPAGYGGFVVNRHGVILAGYSNGLRPGPCLVNGRPSRVLEVGMQSAFVECAAGDRAGDEIVLLGDGVELDAIASQWRTSQHEALLRLAELGPKNYVPA